MRKGLALTQVTVMEHTSAAAKTGQDSRKSNQPARRI